MAKGARNGGAKIYRKNRVIDIKPSLNLNTNNEKINDELKDRFRPEFLSS